MPGLPVRRQLRSSAARAAATFPQAAERAGEGYMVRIVAGFDDHPVSDPGDEDARERERAAARRSLVPEFGDDDLRIAGLMHLKAGGGETLCTLGAAGAFTLRRAADIVLAGLRGCECGRLDAEPSG